MSPGTGRSSGTEGVLAELLADRCELRLHERAALPVRAVDDERLARDVARVRAGQERGGPTEFARAPGTERRDASRVALAAARNVSDLLGLVLVRHQSRDQTVHPDPVWRPFHRERLREVVDAGLR